MTNLFVGSWNLRGIQSKKNREEKIKYLLGTSFDILCIQELRLKSEVDGNDVIRLWEKGLAIISIGNDLADGVGILFKSKDVQIHKRRDIIPGRLLMVDCVINGIKIRIINVYTSQKANEKMQLFRKLQEITFTGHHVIVCGDYNTITESNDRISNTPFRISPEGKCLKEVTNNVDLVDVFRKLNPNVEGFTRFDSLCKTRIDRIYTSKTINPINYNTILTDASDHLIVMSLLSVGKNEKRGYWKLNVKCFENAELTKDLEKEIRKMFELKCLTKSYIELWEIMKCRIRDYFKCMSKVINIERNLRYDQLTKQVLVLKSKNVLSENEQKDLYELKKELNNYNNEFLFNIKKEAGFNTISDSGVLVSKALTLCKKRREKRFLESVLDKEGCAVSEEKEKRRVIQEMCSEKYKRSETNFNKISEFLEDIQPLSKEKTLALLGEITKEEVKIAIKQLSVNKSPGPDGLSAELYLLLFEPILITLTAAFNEGIKEGRLSDSFYQGVMTMLHKKGDRRNLDNYRHLTLMNTDYKILAKVIMNRLMNILDQIIEQEQTCAIKGRVMWDNLCIFRDIITSDAVKDCYIIGLDQKQAFDLISRDYLWLVMKKYGFPNSFIDMVKLLYARSTVQINVNGVLTDPFEIEKGVKQGCPVSAALYILAINPLIKRINRDMNIQGITISTGQKVTALAYADDVSIIIRNQAEMNIVNKHFELYEEVAGAKLNQDKTEGVWMGVEENKPEINVIVKDEIKVLGLYISKEKCCEKNWEKRIIKLKEEINKYDRMKVSYRSKVEIQKCYLISTLMFLGTIFPPPRTFLTKMNKMCVNFIWGTNYEITKRKILFRSKKNGGLDAVDLDLKLKILFVKNIANGIERRAIWVGDPNSWKKRYGRSRNGIPDYKLLYGDFIKKYECLNIDWSTLSSKMIYSKINEKINGGMTQYEDLNEEESIKCVKNIYARNLSHEMQDRAFLISQNKLPVRHILRWCNRVNSTECPIPNCPYPETLQHFLFECDRSRKVWASMVGIGFDVEISNKSCRYGIFRERMDKEKHDFFWWIICVIVAKLWKTRCKMSLGQVQIIPHNVVFNQILTSLKRARTLDKTRRKETPWHYLNF